METINLQDIKDLIGMYKAAGQTPPPAVQGGMTVPAGEGNPPAQQKKYDQVTTDMKKVQECINGFNAKFEQWKMQNGGGVTPSAPPVKMAMYKYAGRPATEVAETISRVVPKFVPKFAVRARKNVRPVSDATINNGSNTFKNIAVGTGVAGAGLGVGAGGIYAAKKLGDTADKVNGLVDQGQKSLSDVNKVTSTVRDMTRGVQEGAGYGDAQRRAFLKADKISTGIGNKYFRPLLGNNSETLNGDAYTQGRRLGAQGAQAVSDAQRAAAGAQQAVDDPLGYVNDKILKPGKEWLKKDSLGFGLPNWGMLAAIPALYGGYKMMSGGFGGDDVAERKHRRRMRDMENIAMQQKLYGR